MSSVGGAVGLQTNFEFAEGGEVSGGGEAEGVELEVELGLGPGRFVGVGHLLAHVHILGV